MPETTSSPARQRVPFLQVMSKLHRTFRRALNPIAIIPCLALLAFTYVVGGMAMMQADDFNREMTAVEILVAMLWVVPVAWLMLIIAKWVRAGVRVRSD